MPQHTAAKRASKRKAVSNKIKVLKKEGRPQKQAVAIALDIQRRKSTGRTRKK